MDIKTRLLMDLLKCSEPDIELICKLAETYDKKFNIDFFFRNCFRERCNTVEARRDHVIDYFAQTKINTFIREYLTDIDHITESASLNFKHDIYIEGQGHADIVFHDEGIQKAYKSWNDKQPI